MWCFSPKIAAERYFEKEWRKLSMNFLKKNGAGLLLCLVIAVPSWFLGQAVPVIGGPVFAILIGMVLTLILTKKEPFLPGVNYTSKKILRLQSSSSDSA